MVAFSTKPQWFWLSFVQDNEFLGCSIVWGRDARDAIRRAHHLGCNPGGEVQAQQLADGWRPKVEYANRLMSVDEARLVAAWKRDKYCEPDDGDMAIRYGKVCHEWKPSEGWTKNSLIPEQDEN